MRGDHKDSERTDRHSSRVASAASPVQKSPNTPTPAAQPVQNSPNTPKKAHFSLFCPSRENYVPLAPPRPPAGRTLYRTKRQTRYKTLPTHPQRPISARFTRAGRTLYRSHHHDPSRENFLPHPAPNPVQNSPCSAGPSAQPVQNSPNTPTPAAQPVQNSPSTPRQQPNRYKTPPTRTVPHPCRE